MEIGDNISKVRIGTLDLTDDSLLRETGGNGHWSVIFQEALHKSLTVAVHLVTLYGETHRRPEDDLCGFAPHQLLRGYSCNHPNKDSSIFNAHREF